jgi:hypothetical protein
LGAGFLTGPWATAEAAGGEGGLVAPFRPPWPLRRRRKLCAGGSLRRIDRGILFHNFRFLVSSFQMFIRRTLQLKITSSTDFLWNFKKLSVSAKTSFKALTCKCLDMKIRFLAVFGGIKMACSSMFYRAFPAIPKGLSHSAQGWPIPRGLPWVAGFIFKNPERVAPQTFMKRMKPLQGFNFSLFSPRVARSSQPWAESCNPVGIGKTKDKATTAIWYSIENSEEPELEAFGVDTERVDYRDLQRRSRFLPENSHSSRREWHPLQVLHCNGSCNGLTR